jgi:glycosyltransferase involved in cell wall biosynthesis
LDYPKISVVIPSFNQGAYIERTLLSIIGQAYPGKVEIIVSDGGSTDGTVEILKKYQNYLTWWSQKDNGYADAVNKGFAVATGDIFAIQSSDDFYLQDSFIKLITRLWESPDSVLICGREAIMEPGGFVFGGYELPAIISPRSFLMEHPFPGIFQHTTFFRRRFFEKVGGARHEFDICADTDLYYRMLHFGNGLFLNEYIGVYQRHDLQRTNTEKAKFGDKLIEMVSSCQNDEAYNQLFSLSPDDLKLFETFIKLFYLQFENKAKASELAKEISESIIDDNRIANLVETILKKDFKPQENRRNLLKVIERKVRKILISRKSGNNIIVNDVQQPGHNINSAWWEELIKK